MSASNGRDAGPPVRVGVLGATGYVGSNVVRWGQALGIDVLPAETVRVEGVPLGETGAMTEAWCRANDAAFERQGAALEKFDVVVNAAGAASPRARTTDELFLANAVQPAVVARAAGMAGVRRLVHVSTAAVQGRLEPLDETASHQPLSPYGESKAAGERELLAAYERGGAAPAEVVVYRPTSVYDHGRPATHTLARLAATVPFLPVAGGPDRPVPVALGDNVFAGIVFAATCPEPLGIVLQPWEGITARSLLALFGARMTMPVPPRMVELALAPLAWTTTGIPSMVSRLRWLELVLRGQGVRAEKLLDAGFSLPKGDDAWRALGRLEQSSARRARPFGLARARAAEPWE